MALQLKHILIVFCLLLISLSSAFSQTQIVVEQGQNVRNLAQKHLGNPNLWPEILRVNQLKSPADVKPGMTLKLPDRIITKANDELETTQKTIDEATKAGAKIFAPHIIAEAIQLQNKALTKRVQGDWQECYELAKSAGKSADEAYKKSQAGNNVSSEATLMKKRGTVQSRKPSDLIWVDLAVNSILIEGEKIRTLRDSYAEILFNDGSQLQLNANSQAIIRKMQVNVLNKKEESSVSLTEGDAFFLLEGNRQKNDFNVDIAGLTTKINSSNFWIKADSIRTKFANYDGQIEVLSGNNTIVLNENQVSTISGGNQSPIQGELLPPPTLITPAIDTTLYHSTVELKWEKVSDAVHYWLEIAYDRVFKRVIYDLGNLKTPRLTKKLYKDGVYYWRVTAVDKTGFPGEHSEVQFFRISNDTEPPYLVIHSLRNNQILVDSPTRIMGEIEQEAALDVINEEVGLSITNMTIDNGVFKFDCPLKKGINTIILKAADRAGNTTVLKRSLLYAPPVDVDIIYDSRLVQKAPKHFLTRDFGFTIVGRTEPETSILIKATDNTFQAKSFADIDGNFQLNLPLIKSLTNFALAVTAPGGHVTTDTFMVEIDNQPVEIQLAQEPPRASGHSKVLLQGRLSEAGLISMDCMNEERNDTPQNEFNESVELRPGQNDIRFSVSDQVGNLSFWDRNVIYDQHPPKFLKHKFSPKYASGGDRLYIVVLAEDESGLKKSAEFKIQAGKYSQAGILEYNRSTQSYEGIVNLPENAKGRIILSYLKLADYIGNEKEYKFN